MQVNASKTSNDQEKPSLDDRLLSPGEVAAILRISKTSVYRIVERREIPFYRLARHLRFRAADVEEYLRRCRVGETAIADA